MHCGVNLDEYGHGGQGSTASPVRSACRKRHVDNSVARKSGWRVATATATLKWTSLRTLVKNVRRNMRCSACPVILGIELALRIRKKQYDLSTPSISDTPLERAFYCKIDCRAGRHLRRNMNCFPPEVTREGHGFNQMAVNRSAKGIPQAVYGKKRIEMDRVLVQILEGSPHRTRSLLVAQAKPVVAHGKVFP